MTGEIRLILALLQQTINSSRESSSIEMMPATAPAGTARINGRAPALVQRSASEPQPQTVPPSTSNNGNVKLQPSTSHSLFRWEILKLGLRKSLHQFPLSNSIFIFNYFSLSILIVLFGLNFLIKWPKFIEEKKRIEKINNWRGNEVLFRNSNLYLLFLKSFLSKSLDQLHLISTSFILERLDKLRRWQLLKMFRTWF